MGDNQNNTNLEIYFKNSIESIDNNSFPNIITQEFSKLGCILIKIQGNRTFMEDNYIIDNYNNMKIFGVLDGHSGSDISKYIPLVLDNINELVYKFIYNNIDFEKFEQKIEDSFIVLDKKCLDKNFKKQGSTCNLVYIGNNKVIIINLGDSKTIILDKSNKISFYTKLHRPNIHSELTRILKNSNFKVVNNNGIYRLNNDLSLTRSFGDFKYKFCNKIYNGISSPVSSIPDLYLQNTYNQFIIIATDGFWDYITHTEIENIVSDSKPSDLNTISKQLVMTAIDNGSNDNITLILINIEELNA